MTHLTSDQRNCTTPQLYTKAGSSVAPKRLWLVAGSGFLCDVLASIWPDTTFLIVQVSGESRLMYITTHY